LVQPSAFSLQPSAFSLQPSAFSLQPSAFSLQLSAFSFQVSGLTALCSRKAVPPFQGPACAGSSAPLPRGLVQVWRHFAPAKPCRPFRVPHARDLPHLSPEAWFSFPPSSAPSDATLWSYLGDPCARCV